MVNARITPEERQIALDRLQSSREALLLRSIEDVSSQQAIFTREPEPL